MVQTRAKSCARCNARSGGIPASAHVCAGLLADVQELVRASREPEPRALFASLLPLSILDADIGTDRPARQKIMRPPRSAAPLRLLEVDLIAVESFGALIGQLFGSHCVATRF